MNKRTPSIFDHVTLIYILVQTSQTNVHPILLFICPIGRSPRRKEGRNEERYEIWTDDNSLRIDGTRRMAPRLQVTDPAESIRKKRAPLDRQRVGAVGGGVFLCSRKRASRLAGPRLTGNGSLRVESGRVSSPCIYFLLERERERWILILRWSGGGRVTRLENGTTG